MALVAYGCQVAGSRRFPQARNLTPVRYCRGICNQTGTPEVVGKNIIKCTVLVFVNDIHGKQISIASAKIVYFL